MWGSEGKCLLPSLFSFSLPKGKNCWVETLCSQIYINGLIHMQENTLYVAFFILRKMCSLSNGGSLNPISALHKRSAIHTLTSGKSGGWFLMWRKALRIACPCNSHWISYKCNIIFETTRSDVLSALNADDMPSTGKNFFLISSLFQFKSPLLVLKRRYTTKTARR